MIISSVRYFYFIAWVIAISLSMSACESNDEKLRKEIRGTWLCHAQFKENGMPMRSKALIQYMSDNKSGMHAYIPFQTPDYPGRAMTLEVLISGAWNISDGAIEEKLQTINMIAARAEGKTIWAGELSESERKEIESELLLTKGYTVSSKISEINDDRLILETPRANDKPIETSCVRS